MNPIEAFANRILFLHQQGHSRTIITLPSASAAARLRFRFYSWRKRTTGLHPDIYRISLSITNSDLIASLTLDDEFASQLIPLAPAQSASQPPLPTQTADLYSPPDTMNDVVRDYMKS